MTASTRALVSSLAFLLSHSPSSHQVTARSTHAEPSPAGLSMIVNQVISVPSSSDCVEVLTSSLSITLAQEDVFLLLLHYDTHKL